LISLKFANLLYFLHYHSIIPNLLGYLHRLHYLLLVIHDPHYHQAFQHYLHFIIFFNFYFFCFFLLFYLELFQLFRLHQQFFHWNLQRLWQFHWHFFLIQFIKFKIIFQNLNHFLYLKFLNLLPAIFIILILIHPIINFINFHLQLNFHFIANF
jgi:hypothetical protein